MFMAPVGVADWDVGDAVRQRINLSWLIKLRWGALMGQTLAVGVVWLVLQAALPLSQLLIVLAATAISNVLLTTWMRRVTGVPQALLGGVITLDILLLTVLLYYTGGSSNPFNFLYLIHIALAAVTLQVRWMGALAGLASACFASLFWQNVPLSLVGCTTAELPPRLHALGMFVAFALAASFIVYFVHRVTAELAQKEGELRRARDLSERNQRLTSLATLAAGAAHELATPLATIAVISKELERQLVREGSTTAAEDAYLIRQEVERCRSVLTHMAADAGADQGEPLAYVPVAALIQRALQELPNAHRVRTHVMPSAAEAMLFVPMRGLAQALRAVVKNALEASQACAGEGQVPPVTLRATAGEGLCVLTVLDAGHGMSSEILARISEPFFTTKGPGSGMGLGLFLTRTLLERLGGSMEVRSTQQRGTTATLCLPLAEPSGEG